MLCKQEKQIVFDQQRCCQCGVCLAACPTGALTMRRRDDGLFAIEINDDACTQCGRCVRCCPAAVLPHTLVDEADWAGLLTTGLCHATDDTVRHHASSGGVARLLIKHALRSGMCERAYCLVRDDEYPWARGAYLEQVNDLSTIANSMYLPIPALAHLADTRPKGRLLIVGTPCQLLAAEQYFRSSDVTLIQVAILCKQQKSYRFTQFIRQQLGVPPDDSTPMQYRGTGWPGFLGTQERRIAYEQAAGLPYGKALWRVPGCRFCGHLLGANADLTLADPWKIVRDAGAGMTLTFVRTQHGAALLDSITDVSSWIAIDSEQGKTSVDWTGYQRKQARIADYLGTARSPARRLRFAVGEAQRSAYEWLLMRGRIPWLLVKVLNRLPYFG